MIHYFLLKIRCKYTQNVVSAKCFWLKYVVSAKCFQQKYVVSAKCLVFAFHEQGHTDEEMDGQVHGGDQDIGVRICTKSHIVNFLDNGR